ncbi:MAG TPA: dCTP deaminase [Gemmataceae bacterium]|nr:dCTP deaminase [Gemmataceae bacterium]
MSLSNLEIQKAIDEGRLILAPEPLPRRPSGHMKCPYDTHSVDLTLAPKFIIPKAGPYCYDPGQPGELADFIADNSTQILIPEGGSYLLEPNCFILAMTRETVGLPIDPARDTCLAARIEGKSSRARCAILVHFTAPTIHPGFHGPITLEMINLGRVPFLLRPGMAIAQLIVEEVKGIPFDNPSQFQGQTNPAGTK